MKAWNEDGKTLTEEYKEAHWDAYWAIHKQKAKLDASLLAITAVGGRGPDGALEEMDKMESLLIRFKDLRCLQERERKPSS